MPKLCGCFKANKDDHNKQKQTKRDSNIKLNGKKYTNFDLFLAGDDESGKTKLIKELAISHDPFTLKDKVLKTSEIERYVRDSLTDILRAFKRSNPAVQFEYPENQQSVNYILKTAHQTDFDYPLEFFEHVEKLWVDAGLQTFLKKPNEHRFDDSAKYFLDQVSRIRDPDYVPTTEDMIQFRLVRSHVFKMSFDLEKEGVRFSLLETDFLSEEQQESIQSFPNSTSAIIFITDCSCFDIITDEAGGETRLHQSIELFKTIRTNESLETTPVILLLNKQDLLAEKIKKGVRLQNYFPEFENYVLSGLDLQALSSDRDPEITRAKYFIHDQFVNINPNNCYRHFISDSDICVHLIFHNCRAMSQQMVLQRYGI